jgi:hypothetical protein
VFVLQVIPVLALDKHLNNTLCMVLVKSMMASAIAEGLIPPHSTIIYYYVSAPIMTVDSPESGDFFFSKSFSDLLARSEFGSTLRSDTSSRCVGVILTY